MDFTERVEAEIPCLHRYAHKLTRERAAAEELVQECVFRGLNKQHLWQEGTNLRAWLCTILHNAFVDEIRRTAREATTVELDKVDEQLSHPPHQEKAIEWRDVSRAVGALPRGQRQALILIRVDGWSYEQAAKALRVPIGTVRSRLSRGRERLKAAA
jgi:RNA polymerase sigma-70 factor, ECF subfamily